MTIRTLTVATNTGDGRTLTTWHPKQGFADGLADRAAQIADKPQFVHIAPAFTAVSGTDCELGAFAAIVEAGAGAPWELIDCEDISLAIRAAASFGDAGWAAALGLESLNA